MLPAMTAAVLLAQRKRGVLVGRGGRVRDAGEADRRGHAAARPLHPVAPARARARASTRSAGSRCRSPWSRSPLGPGELLYWTMLGNGSYVSVNGEWLFADRPAVRDDADVRRCATSRSCGRSPRAWRERKTRRPRRHRPVAVAAVGRDLGRARAALLRPLLPPGAAAAVPAHGERARALEPARLQRHGRGGTADRESRCRPRASSCGRSTNAPSTRPSAAYLKRAHRTRSTASSCGAAAGDLLGVGRPPGHAVHHRRRCSPGTTTTEPAQPVSNVRPEQGTPELWQWFYEDFAQHPPRYILDARACGCAARRTSRSREYPGLRARSCTATTTSSAPSTGSPSTSARPTPPPPVVPARTFRDPYATPTARAGSGSPGRGSGSVPVAEQVVGAHPQRLELERRQQRRRAALRRRRLAASATRHTSSASGGRDRLAGEVPDDGAQLPRRVEREPVVDAEDHAVGHVAAGSGRPCGRRCWRARRTPRSGGRRPRGPRAA